MIYAELHCQIIKKVSTFSKTMKGFKTFIIFQIVSLSQLCFILAKHTFNEYTRNKANSR